MENKKQTKRHKELSLMFLEMGKALVDEGLKNKDYITASLGNNLICISSLTSDKEDVKLFSELCSMMMAKKLVSDLSDGTIDISDLVKLKDVNYNNTFDEIIKRIKKDFDNNDLNND